MSEYRRLISYMYAYDNGIKNKNVGFAKTERKGGAVKLWINLKGAYAQGENFNVYFFIRHDEAIVGIYMGSMVVRNGMGQVVISGSENSLKVSFDEIRGIYIKCDGEARMFASQWDDLGFAVDKITTYEEYNAAAATAEAVEEVLTEKVLPEEASKIEKPEKEPPVWERPIKMMYVDDEAGTQLHVSEESDAKAAEQQPQSGETDTDSAEKEQPAVTVNNTHSAMDMLFDGKEPKLVFSEDEIYDCVDIGLNELPKISGADKGLLNNSFVNHGYFNFHHLLLGKKDGNILVIGVPGVYNRREKMTANMFGFEKFKFSMRSDVCMNHFGYWYKEYQC